VDLDLAKALYFRELDRRTELDGAPTMRVAILALLGGLFSYYSQRFIVERDLSSVVFIIGTAGTIFFAVVAVIWIIRSYVGFTWAYLPFPDQLESHFQALIEYQAQYAFETAPEVLFTAHLRQRLIEAASQNASNNNQRAELIYRASLFLSIAVIFSLVAGAPVLFRSFSAALR
jgi:hypothetical protein